MDEIKSSRHCCARQQRVPHQCQRGVGGRRTRVCSRGAAGCQRGRRVVVLCAEDCKLPRAADRNWRHWRVFYYWQRCLQVPPSSLDTFRGHLCLVATVIRLWVGLTCASARAGTPRAARGRPCGGSTSSIATAPAVAALPPSPRSTGERAREQSEPAHRQLLTGRPGSTRAPYSHIHCSRRKGTAPTGRRRARAPPLPPCRRRRCARAGCVVDDSSAAGRARAWSASRSGRGSVACFLECSGMCGWSKRRAASTGSRRKARRSAQPARCPPRPAPPQQRAAQDPRTATPHCTALHCTVLHCRPTTGTAAQPRLA